MYEVKSEFDILSSDLFFAPKYHYYNSITK